MRITYYVASSIDGFIAKENGDVSWLDNLGVSMEETGYDAFFASVDGLVMGRKTYEFILNYGSWPYDDKPTWVCTSSKLDLIDGCNLQNGNKPKDVEKKAEDFGLKHLWLVGGGKLAASFIKSEILTHLSISQMPIILGGGIKIFDNLEEPINIKRQNVQPFNSGFSQLEYELEYA